MSMHLKFSSAFERYAPSNQLMLSKATSKKSSPSPKLDKPQIVLRLLFRGQGYCRGSRPNSSKLIHIVFSSSQKNHHILSKVTPLLTQLKIPGNVDRVYIPQLVVILTDYPAPRYRFPLPNPNDLEYDCFRVQRLLARLSTCKPSSLCGT